MTTRGGCFCGGVTYEFDGAENWRAYCPCDGCRRKTSSPVTAFFAVSRSAFRFTGKAPAVYASSPGVGRLFCGRCGSPMAYETDRRPQEIDLYALTIEHPANYRPPAPTHAPERPHWFDLRADLPRLPTGGQPPGA